MQERFLVTKDNLKLYYRIRRSKTRSIILFLPGLGANWTQWKDVLDFFNDKGFSTLTLDYRGHGLSDKPYRKERYAIASFVRDIKDLLKEENVESVVLVGHSFGGVLSLIYALGDDTVDIKSLVLIDTPCEFPFKHHDLYSLGTSLTTLVRMLARAEDILGRIRPVARSKSEVDYSKLGNRSNFWKYLHGITTTPAVGIISCLDNFERADFTKVKEKAKSIKQPVLILEGAKDMLIPIKQERNLKKILKNSVLKLMDGDHFVPLQRPEEVSEEIYSFLRKHRIR